MGTGDQAGRCAAVFIFSMIFLVCCATIPVLNVTYRLPLKADDLKGRKLFFAFEDIRSVKDFMGPGAIEDFSHFSGDVSFSLARGDEPGFKIGPRNIPALFKEAFRRRLENSGAEVVSRGKGAQTGLIIALKECFFDLRDRKWVMSIDYEARLARDGDIRARQSISGQAERLKIIGTKQADEVVGEIFTDIVNKLDIQGLFQQAGI